MDSPLSANDDEESVNDDNDGHSVHLVYSEYDSAPSETDVEVIEGPLHYWWTSSKSLIDEIGYYYNHAPHTTNNYCSPQEGKEVCLVYSDYDEPSSETSVNMDKFFYNNNNQGREVRLIYSEYEEPPSETDVEYDGRPWCSIFGNPALWKIRDEGREVHLVYSDYTEPESEAIVELEDGIEPKIVEISELETAEEEPITGKEWEVNSFFEDSEYVHEAGKIIGIKPIEIVDSESEISDEPILQTGLSVSDGSIPQTGLSVSDDSIPQTGLSVSDDSIPQTGLSVSDEPTPETGLSVSDESILETGLSESILETGLSVSDKSIPEAGINVSDESILETGISVSHESNLETAYEPDVETGKATSIVDFKTAQKLSSYSEEITDSDNHFVISSDIYTKRPPKLRASSFVDSFEFIGQKSDKTTEDSSELQPVPSSDIELTPTKKVPVVVRSLTNLDQLLAFSDTVYSDSISSSRNENSLIDELESWELNTAKGNSSMDSVHTGLAHESALDRELATLDQDSSSSLVSFE